MWEWLCVHVYNDGLFFTLASGQVWWERMISYNWVATLVYIGVTIIDSFYASCTNSIAPCKNRLQC